MKSSYSMAVYSICKDRRLTWLVGGNIQKSNKICHVHNYKISFLFNALLADITNFMAVAMQMN